MTPKTIKSWKLKPLLFLHCFKDIDLDYYNSITVLNSRLEDQNDGFLTISYVHRGLKDHDHHVDIVNSCPNWDGSP